MLNYLLRSKVVCPDYNKNYPRITHGNGCYLFDVQGKQYLDASAGSCAVNLIGHGHAGIVDVLAKQSQKASVLPSHYLTADIIHDYLHQLCNFSGFGRRAWTCSSGSEAVENAMKAALQYHQIKGDTRRYKIIGRHGSYHGNSIFTLDIGGMRLRREPYKPLLNDFAHAQPAFCYRCPANKEPNSCNVECADSIRSCIEQEGPETVAAFIAEPVVGAALGGVDPDPRYFKRVRDICDDYGILLIVDEVMSGMGRTGHNFAMEHWDCVPDILATGKGLGGGYFPLSAFIVNQHIAEAFSSCNEPFYGGHTHACTPQAAAVGQYVLDYIDKNQIVKKVAEKGCYLRKRLQSLLKYDIVGDIRGIGYLIGIEFVEEKATKCPFPNDFNVSSNIGDRLLQRGIILYPGIGSCNGMSGDHILITPPLTMELDEIDILCDALDLAIREEMHFQLSKTVT